MLRSQQVRAIAPEMDPLRVGMGWKVEELSRPQIMIESTFGDSHPGSAHLLRLADEAAAGVYQAGGRRRAILPPTFATGMAQGHDGINYSLASRDAIANLIEIHEKATPFDAGVFISSCDKAVPPFDGHWPAEYTVHRHDRRGDGRGPQSLDFGANRHVQRHV